MSRYVLEIAGARVEPATDLSAPASLVRLTRTDHGRTDLELLLRDPALIDRTGLRSRVDLSIDGEPVFTGHVFAQETFSRDAGYGKRLTAYGPFLWSRFVTVTDEGGVPRRQFARTDVGSILRELLSRHGSALRDLSAAGEHFDAPIQTADLSEPVDLLWVENQTLDAVVGRLMDLGGYRLGIDPRTRVWNVLPPDRWPIHTLDLRPGGIYTLAEYRVRDSLADRCAAVRLVSDRAVRLAYAAALPAWNPALEPLWQLRHAHYAQPDADQPDDLAWVFRRFRYDHLPDLLEYHPLELVRKVPTETGQWTYQIIETLPADRVGKYLTARSPVLDGPTGRRVNLRNPLPAGKSQSPQVFIRYRCLEDHPAHSHRYPPDGFAGPTRAATGLTCERVMYLADVRQIGESQARRWWRTFSALQTQIDLTVNGPAMTDLLAQPRRVRLTTDQPGLPSGETFWPARVEYDFTRGKMHLRLERF